MAGAVLVLGATGEVGRRVVAGLRARRQLVRGASRDPARAAASDHGEWVRLDLERPDTFSPALEGADRLFLMARPGDDHPERLAGPLIAAARNAGVRHVVNLTAMGVEREPEFGLRQVELLLESSRMDFTHLRPNFFMQIFAAPPLLPAILATGTIRLPTAEARLSFVDTRDIADVAVAALTRSTPPKLRVYTHGAGVPESPRSRAPHLGGCRGSDSAISRFRAMMRRGPASCDGARTRTRARRAADRLLPPGAGGDVRARLGRCRGGPRPTPAVLRGVRR